MNNLIRKPAEKIIVRNALWGAFGVAYDVTMEEVARDLHTGVDNPGEHAPAADWVVYTERGIPNPMGYVERNNRWQEVVDKIQSRLGCKAVWFESVNASVVAIYIE